MNDIKTIFILNLVKTDVTRRPNLTPVVKLFSLVRIRLCFSKLSAIATGRNFCFLFFAPTETHFEGSVSEERLVTSRIKLCLLMSDQTLKLHQTNPVETSF